MSIFKGLKKKLNQSTISYMERQEHFYTWLKQIALSRFKWINLPDEIDERFLEMTLFEKGQILFFKDEFVNLFAALPCTLNGHMNIYDIWSDRLAYANNGYQYWTDYRNSVLIFNNYLRSPDHMQILYFSKRLAQMETTVDVNMNGQRMPRIIACDENQRLTVENMIKQVDSGALNIFTTNNFNMNEIKVLDNSAPFVADKVQDQLDRVWNQALTYLGVPNLSVQKKERLITDEVQKLQAGSLASSCSPLEMRRECAEKINKLFGLDVKVEMRLYKQAEMEEGDNNEQVYDGSEVHM